MKHLLGTLKSVLFLALFAFPLALLANDVVPMPAPVLEDGLLEWILAVLSFGKGVAGGVTGWALIAGALKLLVDATKLPILGGIFDKLGSVGKLMVVNGAAAALVGVSALASGASLMDALAATVASSAGAVFLNEIVKAIKKALGVVA